MRTKTDYYIPVSNNDGEIKVLDYSFIYDDNSKGLTGSTFVPISKAELKETIKKKNVIEFLSDCLDKTQKEFEKMYKELKANDELVSFMFDLSYQNQVWNKLRELGYSEKEWPIFNCIGGGRCFKVGEKFNLRPDLEHLLNEFES